jgi:surface antigen
MRTSKLVAIAFVAFGFVLASNHASASRANQQPTAQRQQAAKSPSARPAAQAQPARANAQPANTRVRPVRANQAVQGPRRSSAQVHRVAFSAPPGGISCVPYARQATGIAIRGNGGDWWHNAAGLYARGHRPEPGAIMAFSPTGKMQLGHVAVVQEVLSPRKVLIHHANWGGPGISRGAIMSDVSVVDVSLHNDWSSVRVQVGWDRGSLGSIYPIQGFIYDRPDNGYIRTASAPRPGGPVLVNAHSLRPSDVRGFEELAQAPARNR